MANIEDWHRMLDADGFKFGGRSVEFDSFELGYLLI